jgi:hypothetical protein
VAKVGSTPAKFDFRTQTIADLQQKMPKLFNTVRTVSRLSGVSFQYLIASMYVESGLDTKASNGHAKGIAQIKGVAWKEVVASDLFKTIWTKLASKQKIPAGPGKSMEADIVALAVLTQLGDEKCGIAEWRSDDTKDKARRLCYHLSHNVASQKIKSLGETGEVSFNDAANQKSWNRFAVVLDKAKLIQTLAKSK